MRATGRKPEIMRTSSKALLQEVTRVGRLFLASLSVMVGSGFLQTALAQQSPEYVVTTLAGQAGITNSTDGLGSDARFNQPFGLTVDTAGNTYVADTFNHTVRTITPGAIVTTLAGQAGSAGSTNGTGT